MPDKHTTPKIMKTFPKLHTLLHIDIMLVIRCKGSIIWKNGKGQAQIEKQHLQY